MSRTIERDTVAKQGDAKILWLEANGDLALASSITWQARRSPSAPSALTRTVVFQSFDGRSSLLRVDLTATETAELGVWLYEVVAVVAGQTYHWPDEGFLRLRVVDDLD